MHAGEKETWDQSLGRRMINGENEPQLLGNWKEQVLKNVKY
jgi:hypothetical protein